MFFFQVLGLHTVLSDLGTQKYFKCIEKWIELKKLYMKWKNVDWLGLHTHDLCMLYKGLCCLCIRMILCHTLHQILWTVAYTWAIFSYFTRFVHAWVLVSHTLQAVLRVVYTSIFLFYSTVDTIHRCKGLLGRAQVPFTPPWHAKASTHSRSLTTWLDSRSIP